MRDLWYANEIDPELAVEVKNPRPQDAAFKIAPHKGARHLRIRCEAYPVMLTAENLGSTT